MADRCTGHCCRRFALPLSPEELKKHYDDWRSQSKETPHVQDIWLIAPMAKYVGFLYKSPNGDKLSKGAYYYSCKHLGENGDCTIYEMRPKMCADYPYGDKCEYVDCTLPNRGASERLKIVE